jgi:hypothetical protein
MAEVGSDGKDSDLHSEVSSSNLGRTDHSRVLFTAVNLATVGTPLDVNVNLVPVGNKQTPWPLVRKRTIPTERPPLID